MLKSKFNEVPGIFFLGKIINDRSHSKIKGVLRPEGIHIMTDFKIGKIDTDPQLLLFVLLFCVLWN